MSDSDAELERRLAAVERAVDGEADLERREKKHSGVGDLTSRVETLESRLDELDAVIQSVRGFLGGVSAVNESVERRADAAVAAVERLERRLDEGDDTFGDRESAADRTALSSTDDAADEGSAAEESTERGLRERLRDLG